MARIAACEGDAARGVKTVRVGVRQKLRVVHAALTDLLDSIPREATSAPILQSRLAGVHILHLMDPELIRIALVQNAACLDKGESVRRPLGPGLGEGLLTAEGAQWRWQRRALAPLFRPEALAGFMPAMLNEAGRLRDRLAAAAGPVAIERETLRATLAIIEATMLPGVAALDAAQVGRSVDVFLRESRWATLAVLLQLPRWMWLPGQARSRRATRYLRGFLQTLVAGRRGQAGETQGGDARAGDLIGRLLAAEDPQSGRRLSDREIVDNLLTFVVAGHETTAYGLAWTLDLLARHPAVAARAAAEVEAVTGGRPPGAAEIERLAYTRQVFLEALRLYPSAPIIARRVSAPFDLAGITVAPGSRIIVPIFALHRHSALWAEPERFDPDRFAPAAEAARHRYAFMPFGAGPRVCIGAAFAVQEATAILAVLLRELEFLPAGAAVAPRMQITLRPSRPILLRVGRRGC